MKFKEELYSAIKLAGTRFQKNELAYLALTSKIENQIRDKISYILHTRLHKDYLICREWRSKHNNIVDLAILDRHDMEPKCLIEFKALSAMRKTKEYKDFLEKDLSKIADIADDKVELFYIFFCNQPLSSIDPIEYAKSVKYCDIINSFLKKFQYDKSKVKTELIKSWKYYSGQGYSKTKILTLDGGSYYDIKVNLHAFINGPFTRKEIKNRKH